MKLVIILGPYMVGKMTIGQELAKLTGLKLLHNHMTIDRISNFFDVFTSEEGKRLNTLFKQEIIEAVANSDLPGLIHTAMIAFDSPTNLDYIRSLIELFESKNAQICVVELNADYDVRLERNNTENHMLHKPTKRDLQKSEEIFHWLEAEHRFNTGDGEEPFQNYFKINNTHLSANEVAQKIIDHYRL